MGHTQKKRHQARRGTHREEERQREKEGNGGMSKIHYMNVWNCQTTLKIREENPKRKIEMGLIAWPPSATKITTVVLLKSWSIWQRRAILPTPWRITCFHGLTCKIPAISQSPLEAVQRWFPTSIMLSSSAQGDQNQSASGLWGYDICSPLHPIYSLCTYHQHCSSQCSHDPFSR